MTLFESILLTYFVMNITGGTCEFFLKHKVIKAGVDDTAKELESSYALRESTRKVLYIVGYGIGIVLALIIDLLAWAPLKMVMLIKGRAL